jgi:catechol 2,3-dioxygenase-like lactoylglutathione lyase family enzyme
VALPALAVAPRALAQAPSGAVARPPFRVNGLSQITLTVSDVKRSLDFYQGLFGLPVQARQSSTVLLRIGRGPRFIALRQAAVGERPSISALGFGVQDFAVDRAMQALTARGFTAAPAGAEKPGPRQVLVRTRRPSEGGSPELLRGQRRAGQRLSTSRAVAQGGNHRIGRHQSLHDRGRRSEYGADVSRPVRVLADGLSGRHTGVAGRPRRPLSDVHWRWRSDARR